MMTSTSPPAAILLAAGKGTRMGGDLPKVLHEVAGRPMICWVVEACKRAGVGTIVVVVGYQGDQVRRALADEPGCVFVEQAKQLGTGHAAQMAQPVFEQQAIADTFVLAGDGPLIRHTTLARLLEIHRRRKSQATLATAILDDPTGYGRVIRTDAGDFDAIIEQKDASDDQLAVREVNPSYYCFDTGALFATLDQVSNQNASGEYYLTDVPGLLKQQGKTVVVVDAVPAEDVLSINTPEQLAQVNQVLTGRLTPSEGN